MPQDGKEMNTVQFNYFRNGVLVNTKFRTGNKHFKLTSGAELILYNYDNCIGKEQIVIVEGEFDALSCFEAGIHNVVSVPNGAGTGMINLEYLDNCIELFENAKEIIIATDNDIPGINLRNQLSHRLGIERCFKVDFSPFKDSNDILIHEGKESLKNRLILNKESFPIDGVFTSRDFNDDLDLLYSEGLKPGKQINISEFDDLISFEKGRLYTWTGIPGHGKSIFLDQISLGLALNAGWQFAVCSPESYPLGFYYTRLIKRLLGKKFSKYNITPDQLNEARDYRCVRYQTRYPLL